MRPDVPRLSWYRDQPHCEAGRQRAGGGEDQRYGAPGHRDSSQIGGTVIADFREDFVIPEPDLLLDDRLVIEGGEWRF